MVTLWGITSVLNPYLGLIVLANQTLNKYLKNAVWKGGKLAFLKHPQVSAWF